MTTRPSSSVSNTTAISAEAYAQAIEEGTWTKGGKRAWAYSPEKLLFRAREINAARAQRPAQVDALEGVRALAANWRDEVSCARWSNYDIRNTLQSCADELEAALAKVNP